MSEWLATQIPSGILLIGLICLIVGVALLVQRYVRRRFPTLAGGDHNDVTKFTYGFIGFLYAFFIGFVVSSMWGQVNTADGNARAEGAAGVQMARDLTAFEQADAERIRDALLVYERAAIDEWSRSGDIPSTEADGALADVYVAYRDVRAETDLQKTVLATSLGNVDKISEARTVRLLTAADDNGLPWPIWTVIFLTSAMVLGTVIIYGVEKPAMHYPMVAIVGTVVATNLFLILELAHPFVGTISTSAAPLQEVVRVLSGTP
jgi:hypothetical protein